MDINQPHENIKDFSTETPKQPIRFRIGDAVFECMPVLPAYAVQAWAEMSGGKDDDTAKQIMAMIDFVKMLMTPESAERFTERMKQQDNPITFTMVSDIVKWLFEVYANRPTTPSESSGGGVAVSPSSMDTVPHPVLTQSSFH